MTWHRKIIKHPTVRMRAQTPGGAWELCGHGWMLLAAPGKGLKRWRLLAPGQRSIAAALEVGLGHPRPIGELCHDMRHAGLAEAGGHFFNAGVTLTGKGGFLPVLGSLSRTRGLLEEARVGLLRAKGLDPDGKEVPGAILIIGNDKWRLLMMSMAPGALYRFPEVL